MLDTVKILSDGVLFAAIGSVIVLAMMAYNPRLFLNKGDLPADILAAVPPKTQAEKRQAIIFGLPFLFAIVAVPFISTLQFHQQAGGEVSFLSLVIHPFAILMIFNLVDLLILDFVLFCTITPRFMVVPGTEGFAGYKDYGFHIRQHLKSLPFMLLGAILIAIIVSLL
jgi:hypothetical protein